jgi:hypothetical protein
MGFSHGLHRGGEAHFSKNCKISSKKFFKFSCAPLALPFGEGWGGAQKMPFEPRKNPVQKAYINIANR